MIGLTLQISGGHDSSNEAEILTPARWIWLLAAHKPSIILQIDRRLIQAMKQIASHNASPRINCARIEAYAACRCEE